MNADTITRWLQTPAAMPAAHEVESALASWPWFIPVRMMAIARTTREGETATDATHAIRLHGLPWIAAITQISSPRAVQEWQEDAPQESEIQEATAEQHSPFEAAIISPDTAPSPQRENEHVPLPPLFTEDYFRHQGVAVDDVPAPVGEEETGEPQTLMVMMSFAEWLNHYKIKTEQEESEAREKRALRSMWQQEKLAAALEDEPDEIPEDVFAMAVSSITREEDLASESLAQILEKQEKWSAAAEMYKRLALKNPAKSVYFAARADAAKRRSQ